VSLLLPITLPVRSSGLCNFENGATNRYPGIGMRPKAGCSDGTPHPIATLTDKIAITGARPRQFGITCGKQSLQYLDIIRKRIIAPHHQQ